MNKAAKALISWIPAGKGGRQRPPVGPAYSTVARFDEDASWQEWSLVVDFIHSFANGQYLEAAVRFLSDEAPRQLLHGGSRFQLFEGRHMVATGLIREDDAAPVEEGEFDSVLLH